MQSPDGSTGFFYDLGAARVLLQVPMGEVGINFFYPVQGERAYPAIGTEGLGGCTAAVIMSHGAAILAHIPPLPYGGATSQQGEDNVREMMREVREKYYRHIEHFQDPSSHTVCAIFRGAYGLPDHRRIITEKFQQMGFQNTGDHTYVVPGEQGSRGQGTVVVYRDHRAQTTTLYVEDVETDKVVRRATSRR
ncbi:hypothetical protein ACJ41O_007153 [Fusarium nematophilum]